MQSSGGDPTISLGVQVPQASGTAINPLGMLNSWSEIQNRLNQNQLFQQQISAKNGIGEIMSGPGDMESKLNSVAQSPYAGYAGEYLNNMRSVQKTLLDMDLEKGKAGQGVLQDFFKSLGPAYKDPSMVPYIKQSLMGVTPKQISGDVGNAIDSYTLGLTHGLPSAEQMKADPQAAAFATKTVQDRILGSLATAVPGDVLRAMTGTVSPAVTQGIGPQNQPQPQVTGSNLFGTPPQVPIQTPQGSGIIGQATPTSETGNALGAGSTSVNKSYLENRGHDMADYQQKLDSDVQGGYQIMQNLAEARQAMQDFKPGGGADTYKRIGTLAQAFGAPPDMVDKISNGNLGASTEFQKLMVNNVMGQLRQQIPTGSKLNQSEFKVFEDRNPNIDTDPRAIEKIFNFWTKTYGRARDEQASMNQYLKSPGADVSQWPAIWQQMAEKKGYTGGAGVGSVGPQGTTQTIPTQPNILTRPPITDFFK